VRLLQRPPSQQAGTAAAQRRVAAAAHQKAQRRICRQAAPRQHRTPSPFSTFCRKAVRRRPVARQRGREAEAAAATERQGAVEKGPAASAAHRPCPSSSHKALKCRREGRKSQPARHAGRRRPACRLSRAATHSCRTPSMPPPSRDATPQALPPAPVLSVQFESAAVQRTSRRHQFPYHVPSSYQGRALHARQGDRGSRYGGAVAARSQLALEGFPPPRAAPQGRVTRPCSRRRPSAGKDGRPAAHPSL